MTAYAINDLGCVPESGRCLVHDEELVCSHGCENGDHMKHFDCDDPPPPAYPALSDDDCIACSTRIRQGEPVRHYEEGVVHANGCPEGCVP